MIKDFASSTLTAAIVAAILLLPSTTSFAAEPSPTKATSNSELKNESSNEALVSLGDFAARVESGLKSKVIVGQNLSDIKIHINVSKEPLNYGQFLTQLNINGFTAYKSKHYIVIIMNRDARSLPIPVADKRSSYAEDEYITDSIKINKACASELLAAMRPLVPQYGHMTSYSSANILIIVDTYSNIQRIKSMVKTIEENIDTKQPCSDNNSEPPILKNSAVK